MVKFQIQLIEKAFDVRSHSLIALNYSALSLICLISVGSRRQHISE